MPLKLTIKIPSSLGASLGKKVTPLVNRAVSAAMPKIGALVMDRISQEADKVLRTTAHNYKKGLQDPQSLTKTGDSITVQLIGALPVALEEGFDAFDMKAKLLAHAHGKTTPYVDIPFRHAREADAVNMPGMPASVKRAIDVALTTEKAKLKSAGATQAEIATASARLHGKTKGASFTRELLIGGSVVKQKVKHKQGIYDELIRTAVMGRAKAIGKYQTIRRVSANSDPMSWWHPGFRGVKIFAKVMPTIEADMKRILKDALIEVGLKVKK